MSLVVLESSFVNVTILHADAPLAISLVFGDLPNIVANGLLLNWLQLIHAILNEV